MGGPAVSDPRPGLWPLVLEGAQRLGSREEEMLLFTKEGEGWETHKLTEEGGRKRALPNLGGESQRRLPFARYMGTPPWK